MAIDYERAKREFPKQKAALTRALKLADPAKRQAAVLSAAKLAVAAWNDWGAWPDDWSRWQRAIDDSFPLFSGTPAPRLEDL